MSLPNPPEALIAVTYRCNAKCHMCNTWQFPTKKSQELTARDIDRLPGGYRFSNITGGEPFLREDMDEIVEVVLSKTKRLVISTNGYYTEKVLRIAEKFFPRVGVRISIEGLPAANDDLRGLKNGFDHGMRTLLMLRHMGLTDIGFGITVSDRNARDMVELYELAEAVGLEFATAATHNTYYFHKYDNSFTDVDMIDEQFKEISRRLLRSNHMKSWFRAYFNYGLANYVRGNPRLLPCEVGSDLFFMDPLGEVRPCNGLEMSMGNIKEMSFDEIWNGPRAEDVRKAVRACRKECWMVGSAAPAMKKRLRVPARWVLKNKVRSLLGKDIDWRFR